MKWTFLLSLLVLPFQVVSVAAAQTCPFTIDNVNADSVTSSCTHVSGDTWDLYLEIEHSTAMADVRIVVNENESPILRNLVVKINRDNNLIRQINLSIVGPTADPFALAGLVSVTLDEDNEGYLVLEELLVGGDVGFIECHGIGQARIEGDIIDGLTLINRGIFAAIADDILVGGNLLGNVHLGIRGDLLRLEVLGDIGTETDPVCVGCVPGLVQIGTIVCTNFYGYIYAGNSLRRLEVAEVFSGDMTIPRLVAGVGSGDPGVFLGEEIYGDLWVPVEMDADIEMCYLPTASNIKLVHLPQSRHIAFQSSLRGTIEVVEESGFSGQIVINAGSPCSGETFFGFPVWEGNVTIRVDDAPVFFGPNVSQPYRAPYYHALSSELGGGAIGLVPYQFHEKESSPEHDSVVSSAVPTSVTIHHYGPLLDDGNGGTTPVRIFRAGMALPFGFTHHREVPLCYGSVWTEVTSGFDISISGREVHIANDAASFQKGHAYQFIAEGILCGLAAGTPSTFYREDWAWEGAWD